MCGPRLSAPLAVAAVGAAGFSFEPYTAAGFLVSPARGALAGAP
jgi:hypothetical protein